MLVWHDETVVKISLNLKFIAADKSYGQFGSTALLNNAKSKAQFKCI